MTDDVTRQALCLLFEGIVTGKVRTSDARALILSYLQRQEAERVAPAHEDYEERDAKEIKDTPRKPRVDFETGRLTHKRKKRGHVWVSAIKNADGSIRRKGYWISTIKMRNAAKKRNAAALAKREAEGKPPPPLTSDRSREHKRQYNREYKERRRAEMTPEQVRAQRDQQLLLYYRRIARLKGVQEPTSLAEAVVLGLKKKTLIPAASVPELAANDKNGTTQAAAARVYQPHKRKGTKTMRRKKA